MVLNPEKCQFKFFDVKGNELFDLIYNDFTLKHNIHEKNLGVAIFHIYKTANKKLNVLNRIRSRSHLIP